MSSIYSKKYADKYEGNKYIWENETDKNSAAAKKAASENQQIRSQLGLGEDTMSYGEFKNARANYSDYYTKAENVSINPKYKQQSDKLYDSINNFTYNAEDDPHYVAFENAAKRESKSAQKDTYATMTKASGGRNNSFASAATAQVGQAYAAKISGYAKTLADEAYEKLLKKYELSNEMYKNEIDRADNEYKKYIALGDSQVERQRNAIKDYRDDRQAQLDYKNGTLEYDRNVLGYESDKVDLDRNKLGYESDMVDLDRNRLAYESDMVDLDRNKLGYEADKVDYDTQKLNYSSKLNNYQTQLVKNKILNAKNQYEYERWLEDPMYEIKDEKLANAIADYGAYSWLKRNGRDYLYSRFYK